MASPAVWLASLALLGVTGYCLPVAGRSSGFTPTAMAVVGLALWIVFTNGWINPSYSAAGPYHAAFLLGGFLVGRRAAINNLRPLFAGTMALALCVSAWALWQHMGGAARARALFETPATLAALTNLLLVPGLVLVAFGRRSPALFAALVALSAALIAAGSRGAWLAFALSAPVVAVFARRGGVWPQRRSLAMVAAIVAVGWLAAWLMPLLSGASAPPTASVPAATSEALVSSFARLDLYRLALQATSASTWLTGYGYLGFYYLMEAGRDAVRTYGPGTTYFVHNDYLQIFLELGAPGLVLFAAAAFSPFWTAWRVLPRIESAGERVLVVALVASISSMAIHAAVDFPFYIPVCVMIYAMVIGLLDSFSPRREPERPCRYRRAAIAGAVTLGAWLLVAPVVAEVAAAHAQRQWRAAQGRSAAYWFEVARRIQPRDWRYHWYAGQFWYAQAIRGGRPPAAQLADEAFAAGFAANPREVRNLSGRIATHRELRFQLESPADDAALRAWAEAAARLAPFDAAVQKQSAQVLKDLAK